MGTIIIIVLLHSVSNYAQYIDKTYICMQKYSVWFMSNIQSNNKLRNVKYKTNILKNNVMGQFILIL